jgi:class 3 adenylate cyclase
MISDVVGAEPTPRSGFMRQLEARYRPSAGAAFLEDPTAMVRLHLIAGPALIINPILTAVVLLNNGEATVGWSFVALSGVYGLAVLIFLATGRSGVFLSIVVWSSLVQNLSAHVLLGGFLWSGAVIFFGILNSVSATLFLRRRIGMMIAGLCVLAAVVFAFLEPVFRARRSQPALVVSVFLAVDVFVISIGFLVVIVLTLMGQVISERTRSENLLLDVLPAAIVRRLKRKPGVIADAHPSCTVLFADIVGFTEHSTRISPETLVGELNEVFSRFDALVAASGAEKIKTMGDGYMAVAGAPEPRPDHATVMCELALRMQEAMPGISTDTGSSFQLRIGLHTGPLVAGVVGEARLSYDLWGETVNLASRMETMSPAGQILVTDAVVRAAGDGFSFRAHGTGDAKGIGQVRTHLLVGRAQVATAPQSR